MTQKMADAGADAVLVVNPSYYKGQMTVIHVFTKIELNSSKIETEICP